MNNYTEFAMSIAKEAGAFLKKKIGEKHIVSYKGEIDLVTEIDKMSEEMLVSGITGKFPNHDILSEESVKIDRGAEFRWVIDPLDGTTNYAHGYPVFCVSVALERGDEVIVGVIYDPMMEEMFVAEEGKGAFLNGNKVLVSSTQEMTKSLLATGFPYDIRENPDNNLNHFKNMALKAQAVRRAGSAALDLAYIAAGRFDGFWELRLKPWDTAAGWLMVKEAGGLVTDIFGKDYFLKSPHILASNGKIHGEMTDTLKKGASECSSS